MKIKGIVEEDFINYYKPSMLLMMPHCDWKCGKGLCQNSDMALAPTIDVDPVEIAIRYLDNPITQAFIFSGLEPLISFEDLTDTISALRAEIDDDIIIYTGYDEDEVEKKIAYLKARFNNIIVKFGRFIPDDESHYDEVLGISLASSNQYAKKIC